MVGPSIFGMKQRTPMRARKIEGVAVSHERDSRAGKSLDHVALDSPCHGANEAFQRWRANEAFQRWRRICGADFQVCATNVGSWGIQFPMTIRPPGSGHAHHLLGDIERPRREYGSRDAHDEIKAAVFQLV
jgi:hypothetical protein